MARLSRIVIPDVAHHVTQRGNRRLPVFFGDDDRRLYLDLVREGCLKAQVTCLAWCLMDNHVHLVLVPQTQAGLRDALGEAHRRYSRAINFREGWRGYLFQGRFASYPMDDAHLMAAVRYVENNPVAAKLVAQAEDWPWSSARSHIAGKQVSGDTLTDVAALARHVPNWRAYLAHGAEAAEALPQAEAVLEAIEARLRTGRPLAEAAWIAEAERAMMRSMTPAKRGRKARAVE